MLALERGTITRHRRDLKLLFFTVEEKSLESMATQSPRNKKVSNEHSPRFSISKHLAGSHMHLTSSNTDSLKCPIPHFLLEWLQLWRWYCESKALIGFWAIPRHFWSGWAVPAASSDSCGFWCERWCLVYNWPWKWAKAILKWWTWVTCGKKMFQNLGYIRDWLKGVLSEKTGKPLLKGMSGKGQK